jgi:thiol-disulfide isomerase/thioredoxin
MKKLLMLALAAVLTACGSDKPQTHTTLDLGALQGQWVVVNYWAKWCKPCIKEIPELNALDSKYPQVAVFGVNYDGVTGDELAQQVDELNIGFPTLPQDPATELGTDRPMVLPTTLVLNPDGRLVQTLVGPQTLESLVLATGQAAMPEAGPPGEDLINER